MIVEKGQSVYEKNNICYGKLGEMKEIREILSDLNVEVVSMKEAGITADIVEDGATFEENAVIKARAIIWRLRMRSYWRMIRDLRLII